MTPSRLIRRHLARSVVPVLCLAGTAYFGHHALLDDHGLGGLSHLSAQIAKSQVVLDQRVRERQAKEAQVRALYPQSLDADLLDERARSTLGLARPDEVIIFKPQP